MEEKTKQRENIELAVEITINNANWRVVDSSVVEKSKSDFGFKTINQSFVCLTEHD